MKNTKNIINLLFILMFLVQPMDRLTLRNSLSVITIEGGVIMGNELPRYGELCKTGYVRSSPHMDADVLYVLKIGTKVRLREQSHGADRSWAMIAPANWLPLSVLCHE